MTRAPPAWLPPVGSWPREAGEPARRVDAVPARDAALPEREDADGGGAGPDRHSLPAGVPLRDGRAASAEPGRGLFHLPDSGPGDDVHAPERVREHLQLDDPRQGDERPHLPADGSAFGAGGGGGLPLRGGGARLCRGLGAARGAGAVHERAASSPRAGAGLWRAGQRADGRAGPGGRHLVEQVRRRGAGQQLSHHAAHLSFGRVLFRQAAASAMAAGEPFQSVLLPD